jgi:TDG/mug DNA glycosylase family protein
MKTCNDGETLEDYLDSGLEMISIGLNPSLPSVRAGYYFANPRNRFWQALNDSGLVPETMVPGADAMQRLLRTCRIGFTDVVKRPTAGGGELRAADYRRWVPRLRDKLEKYAPAIAWFHGKQAMSNYLRYAQDSRAAIVWGEQAFRLGEIRVFVTPNPSPANAAYTLADLVSWYRRLKVYRDRVVCRN